MASGKRFQDESFEDYRSRLKEEYKALKLKLKGRMIWLSSVIMPSEKDKDVLVKRTVQGTYVKGDK